MRTIPFLAVQLQAEVINVIIQGTRHIADGQANPPQPGLGMNLSKHDSLLLVTAKIYV